MWSYWYLWPFYLIFTCPALAHNKRLNAEWKPYLNETFNWLTPSCHDFARRPLRWLHGGHWEWNELIVDDDGCGWILANIVPDRIQSKDSDGGKRVTTPIKDDSEGHLIYKAGDIINGRCTISVILPVVGLPGLIQPQLSPQITFKTIMRPLAAVCWHRFHCFKFVMISFKSHWASFLLKTGSYE